MKLKPMADNVLLKQHEAAETTVSGIILATTSKEKPAIYEVVAVGPGPKDVTMQVAVGGKIVHMTQTEFNILSFLSQHVGKVMPYSAVVSAIWGSMDGGSVKKLQVNMANIRKKLGCCPGENKYIINELGGGYRMLDDQE